LTGWVTREGPTMINTDALVRHLGGHHSHYRIGEVVGTCGVLGGMAPNKGPRQRVTLASYHGDHCPV
jgi:hypothetical protein